ncbi:hypothetical protein GU926_02725 [Nibribacter ruber]|uniref:branched-chain-amino-acid transaminase n=1 Tax=Nibribacter ruber TaxID=2698458 RepID=A0A6P1NX72_9BACT|nr:aminotransferase class IV [Nibribacter ruber]QHL86415.1 hypothetical protein GU926_02725 [Nibribacter ruber]
MYIIYNGQFLPEQDLRLPLTNRAFQYNDGFFETLVWEKGRLRLLVEHIERMQEAASTLGLKLPTDLSPSNLEEQVKALTEMNDCSVFARVKLKVWRSGQGLYMPQIDTVDWLLTVQPMSAPSREPLNIGICAGICTQPSPFSSFKGPHSLVYVLASREKRERNLEDLLLLDAHGHISELTYSNIFWAKALTLFTPSLATGCLNGVMRRNLLKKANDAGWIVEEEIFQPEVLQEAEVVFSSNVMGLRPIQSIEGQPLALDSKLLQEIKQFALWS